MHYFAYTSYSLLYIYGFLSKNSSILNSPNFSYKDSKQSSFGHICSFTTLVHLQNPPPPLFQFHLVQDTILDFSFKTTCEEEMVDIFRLLGMQRTFILFNHTKIE
ncbi:hypothetical protein AKJ16_DCAP24459 [Drosera capensis]